ncbi:MAG: alpha/beta fold hydrolase [Candidatus Helarchaeota archaeon]
MPTFTRETEFGSIIIHYLKRGKTGDAVFLIHGLGMSKDGWLFQIRPIAKAGFTVYAYDSRGFGKSTMTEFPDDLTKALEFYSLERDVEDCIALMDHLGVEKAHLVGISMGGLITQYICILHPERVISATVANSFSYPHARVQHAANSWMTAVKEMGFAKGFDILLPWVVGEKTLENPLFSDIYNQMKDMYVKANNDWCFITKIQALQALNSESLQDRIHEIKVPLLLIGGNDDILTPPQYQKFTKSLVPHAELIILPEAGHASVLDNPEAFNEAVITFLKKHALNTKQP